MEVGNTDAEGRLVLADALTYALDEHRPRQLIDVATLTGACVVALGEYSAGLFSNDDALSASLRDAGAACAESAWPLPILEEHSAELRKGSPFADLKSIGAGREGGACTAAAFLKEFVEHGAGAGEGEGAVAWAHLDVAGPAMYSTARRWMPKGATGFGVQLLFAHLQSEAARLARA